MARNTRLPDAEQPTTLARVLSDRFDVHTMSESDFSSTGSVTYEISAWVDATRTEDVDLVKKNIEQAGYEITQAEKERGSIWIRAEVETEPRE